MTRRNHAGYVHLRRKTWHIAVEVPRSLRKIVGKARYVRSLKTRDYEEACRRSWKAYAEIRDEIEHHRRGRFRQSDVDRAMALREEIEEAREAGDEVWVDERRDDISFHARRIEDTQGRDAALRFFDLASGEADLMAPLVDKWLDEVKQSLKAQTIMQHRGALIEFMGWLGEQPTLQEVTRRRAGEYISDHLIASQRAPKTINRLVSSISSFWRWLIKRGYREENPWRDQSLPKQKKIAKRPYEDAELQQLLEGHPRSTPEGQVLPSLIRLDMFTGARIDELCSLKVGDCVDGCLSIRDGKSRSAIREVPIHEAIRELVDCLCEGRDRTDWLLDGLRPGGPDGKRSWYVTREFTRYRRQLNLPDGELDFHSLRRTVATKLERAGVPQNVAAELLGHKKQDMTFGVYSGGLTIEPLRDAINRVTYSDEVMRAV